MLYFYKTSRTAFTKMGSTLASLDAVDLGKHAVRSLIHKADIDPALIDEVILGCVSQPANAANIARVIALRSGISESTIASTVHRNCASGMEAITSAYERLSANKGSLFVVGGTESMSQCPFLYRQSAIQKFTQLQRARSPLSKLQAAMAFRPRDFSPIVALRLGLTDPFTAMNMGDTAELLARECDISREDQDNFALQSQLKAAKAQELLNQEIDPIFHHGKSIAADNGIRSDSSLESLAKLRPVFDKKGGTVTAGNSSQITDGSAVLLVGSSSAQQFGLEPIGRLRAYAYAGLAPERMGLGPVFAMQKLFKETGLRLDQADVIEINEAFAAQVIACTKTAESESLARKFGLDGPLCNEFPIDRLNPRGGSIALGHPVGTTGARLVLSALDQLQKNDKQHALTTLCVGGGQGAALWIERLS